MKTQIIPFRLLAFLSIFALVISACQQQEDEEETPLNASETSLQVPLNGQATTSITGNEGAALTISKDPDPAVASCTIDGQTLYVIGNGVGMTSVTVNAEGHTPVTIDLTVLKRKMEMGTVKVTVDGTEYSFYQFVSGWDSLGVFSMKGTTGDYSRSFVMEGVMVSDNGTFSIQAGKLSYQESSNSYVNTGTSFDQLTLTVNDNSGITGSFQAQLDHESQPASVTISGAVIDLR